MKSDAKLTKTPTLAAPATRHPSYDSSCSLSGPGDSEIKGLEGQLQRELRQPRGAGREDAAEVHRVEVRHRQPQVDAVEHVEDLGAELQPHVARHREVAHERHVHVLVAGAAGDV